jgi:hypothetical protein
MFECPAYPGSKITARTCLARQNAKTAAFWKAPYGQKCEMAPLDPHCVDCPVGRKIREQYGESVSMAPRVATTQSNQNKGNDKMTSGDFGFDMAPNEPDKQEDIKMSQEQTTKKTKVCPHCGEEKDINEFGVKRSTKDGRCYLCKVCKRKYDEKYKQKNRTKTKQNSRRKYIQQVTAKTIGKPVSSNVQQQDPEHVLTIDFTDYPEILEVIRQEARQKLRTPDMQALWMLKCLPSVETKTAEYETFSE